MKCERKPVESGSSRCQSLLVGFLNLFRDSIEKSINNSQYRHEAYCAEHRLKRDQAVGLCIDFAGLADDTQPSGKGHCFFGKERLIKLLFPSN